MTVHLRGSCQETESAANDSSDGALELRDLVARKVPEPMMMVWTTWYERDGLESCVDSS